jgi:two-component system phosphate regulon sensor histidine kinase PhoR
LKTPIATVSVAIEALKSFNAMDNPAKTREYLDISQHELQRLSLLVDKVLKLSMFEKKEIELKIETVDLKLLVEEVAASMRLQLEKHQANLSIRSAGDTKVQGDRLHFMSVIFNLLDNAIKYSKARPSIEIDIKEAGEKAELSVADNGIGIPAEYKERIFEKFFRIPTGNLHDAKGYGLGLSYVAHVVNKHQGEIHVESQLGTGSRFIIKLPKLHG